jgi:predicted nucleotidyltransferase
MAAVDPTLISLLADLSRGLRELEVPFCLVGALVPEFLLKSRPRDMTKDADVIVSVQTRADFERLKDRLGAYGFARTSVPHRLRHRGGGLLDLVPYSEALAQGDRLELESGFVLNMAGFRHVVPSAVWVDAGPGLTVPAAPLPLYALLKMVAFTDRQAPKDLASVLHCLEHYREDDEERYGLDHGGQAVPFEYTCAYLLGLDARPSLDEALIGALRPVLGRFDNADSEIVDLVGRERPGFLLEDSNREAIFELFRWFRLGLGM